MTEAQQQFYARLLVDPRVHVHGPHDLDIALPKLDREVRMAVAVRRRPRAGVMTLTVYACDPAPRMSHYDYFVPELGGSRSDVLAFLAGSLPSWKMEKFYEILND